MQKTRNNNIQYDGIAISCDHTGVKLKQAIINYCQKNHYSYIDLGTNDLNNANYAEQGIKLAKYVQQKPNWLGIAICGTGIGISIACNKVSDIRCALIYNKKTAILAKAHNDANIIAFSARMNSIKKNIAFLSAFLKTEFADGRHSARLATITKFEKNRC